MSTKKYNNIFLSSQKSNYNNLSIKSDLLFISVFDFGCLELGLNHLQSLKNQGIYNYMSFVTDDETYNIIIKYGFNCTLVEYKNNSMKKRILILQNLQSLFFYDINLYTNH